MWIPGGLGWARLALAGHAWRAVLCCGRQTDRLTDWLTEVCISLSVIDRQCTLLCSTLAPATELVQPTVQHCCAVHCCLFSFLIVSFLATSSIKLNLNLNLISLRPPTRCGNWIREKFRSAGIAYRKISKTCWRDFLKSLQFQLWA